MARLRQLYPNNYRSSGNISAEVESLVRYLNAAELGNKTVAELLAQIFNDEGVFDGPIEFEKDQAGDIRYRIGTYTNTTEGWVSLIAASELRGEPGVTAGEIGAPIIHSRLDIVPTNGATTIAYAHDASDELLIHKDGILLREGVGKDYTHSSLTGLVTLTVAANGVANFTLHKIRASLISGYNRVDTDVGSSQAVFPFAHDDTASLQVYKNGILQRKGGAYDYVHDPVSGTVTFNLAVAPGNVVSIFTVENTAAQVVTGLMMEENYVDLTTGLIKLAKIAIADGAIAQAKVNGLVTALASKAKLTVSATTPLAPAQGDLWLDTSAGSELKIFTAAVWVSLQPDTALPSFNSANASHILKVNGTGTGLMFAAQDLSAAVLTSTKGAANGVASLDSTGKMPVGQLPAVLSSTSYALLESGATTNGTKRLSRIFKQKVDLTGIAVRTGAGTCSVQIAVNGVGTGALYTASTTPNEITLGTPISLNGTSASVTIDVIVSAVSSCSALDVCVSASLLTA